MSEFSDEAMENYPFVDITPPLNWSLVALEEISVDVSPGFASGKYNTNGAGVPHLRPMNVNRDGQIDLTVIKSVTESNNIDLRAGDVLFNNTNSAELVGKTAVVSARETGFAFSNHMTRIRPEFGVNSVFAARQLHFLWMTGYMKHRCTNHVNQASISSKTLAKTIPFLLPSTAEQTRIVEKLEELLSDLDAGVAELKAARKKLARYRQSLLKAAVEGALTAEWRTQNTPSETGAQLLERILQERRARWEARQLAKFQAQGKTPSKEWQKKYPEPVRPDTRDLPELPQGWVWASVDQLSPDDLANGRSVPTAEVGAKVLRLTAVRDGKIDLTASKCGDWTDDEARPFWVANGDLLIVRGNGSLALVGRAGLASAVQESVAYPDTLIRLRVLNDVINPAWIGLTWDSAFVRKHLEQRARTSAGIYKISQPDIISAAIPTPPFAEQTAILAEIDEARLELALIEHSISQLQRKSAAQRQNILRAAFAGQLVPQDPNDEPANVLLERIRAQREALPTKTRKAKSVTSRSSAC